MDDHHQNQHETQTEPSSINSAAHYNHPTVVYPYGAPVAPNHGDSNFDNVAGSAGYDDHQLLINNNDAGSLGSADSGSGIASSQYINAQTTSGGNHGLSVGEEYLDGGYGPDDLDDLDRYFNSFPPGYKFRPYDEELIQYYLKPKIEMKPLPANRINVVELYKFNPEDLAANFKTNGEKEWYFFTPRDRKYKNGERPNRAAGDGYWKATGADKPVRLGNVEVGSRKALVFYKGKPPRGDKTDWIMHEYRVSNPPKRKRLGNNDMRLDDWVLCRIYKKQDRSCKAPNRHSSRNNLNSVDEVSVPHSTTPAQAYHSANYHNDHHESGTTYPRMFPEQYYYMLKQGFMPEPTARGQMGYPNCNSFRDFGGGNHQDSQNAFRRVALEGLGRNTIILQQLPDNIPPGHSQMAPHPPQLARDQWNPRHAFNTKFATYLDNQMLDEPFLDDIILGHNEASEEHKAS